MTELDVTVSCPCGRTMQPDYRGTRGGYRCGCGRTVRVHVPSRLVYQKDMCCYVAKYGTCDQPAAAGTSLCEIHIMSVLDAAADAYGELATRAREIRRRAQPTQDARHPTRGNHLYTLQLREQIIQAGAVVYYIRTTPGFVKIGTTIDLRARLSSFYLPDTHVLAAEPGNSQHEASRHREFADVRVHQKGRREEFVEREALAEHVRRVHAEHGDPFGLQTSLRCAELQRIEGEGPDIDDDQWQLLRDNAGRVSLPAGETAR